MGVWWYVIYPCILCCQKSRVKSSAPITCIKQVQFFQAVSPVGGQEFLPGIHAAKMKDCAVNLQPAIFNVKHADGWKA